MYMHPETRLELVLQRQAELEERSRLLDSVLEKAPEKRRRRPAPRALKIVFARCRRRLVIRASA